MLRSGMVEISECRIIDLRPDDESAVQQTATLLREVRESFAEGRLSRIAADSSEAVLGWIGGIPTYAGHVWEIHPLVVATNVRRRGIGRALVADIEALAAERGGLTLYAGSDDEDNGTTLSGVDLYDDLPSRIAGIRNLGGHTYEFYQRIGFKIVGVMPDANGLGKPDIILAKRIQAPRASI